MPNIISIQMNQVKAPLIPVHIGIVGHIDSGKTAVARCLSEIVSTAGLDKHDQAQKRGITIDLGFTFFQLENFMITLVDAPGHADLIRSVVSCANIIDLALVVIDGIHGPQVQTGEHLVILETFEIHKILVLVNKIDLLDEQQINRVHSQIKKMLIGSRFDGNYEIYAVSAKTKIGFDLVKAGISAFLHSHQFKREKSSPLKYLIDHHFPKKGFGYIVTGTVLTGSAKIGDNLTILPIIAEGKIKTIQKWKTNAEVIEAGDRCGLGLTDLQNVKIFRGCFATNRKEEFLKGQFLHVSMHQHPLFRIPLHFGQQITISHGMNTISGRIFPIQKHITKNPDHLSIEIPYSPNISELSFPAIIWCESEDFFLLNDKLLISRLDLSPKSLRIVGSAQIDAVLTTAPKLFHLIQRIGVIKNLNYSPISIIVEGFAHSLAIAHKLVGKQTQNPKGRIIATFGTKGNVEVEIETMFRINREKLAVDAIILEDVREFTLDPKKSYSI